MVGHLVDFYNVQFYHQNELNYINGQKLIVTSCLSPYTSICEINRFGHIPLDKLVVGNCTCDRCKVLAASLEIYSEEPLSDSLNPNPVYSTNPKTLSQSFAEILLADALGGISVWKFDPKAIRNNNWSDFRLPLEEQRDVSAFYSDGKNITSDVLRYVVYVDGRVSSGLKGWFTVFSQASSAGANY